MGRCNNRFASLLWTPPNKPLQLTSLPIANADLGYGTKRISRSGSGSKSPLAAERRNR